MSTAPASMLPPWRGALLGRAVAAGLIGSLANTVAIRLFQLTPVPPGTGGLAKMTLAAVNDAAKTLGFAGRVPPNFGPIGQEIFHTLMGVTMALVYALFFYRLLRGPGWLRGFIFCQIPWLLQAFVVLPWLGAGALGLKLSPWTPLASFALNAIFGLTLGAIYRARSIDSTFAPKTPTPTSPRS